MMREGRLNLSLIRRSKKVKDKIMKTYENRPRGLLSMKLNENDPRWRAKKTSRNVRCSAVSKSFRWRAIVRAAGVKQLGWDQGPGFPDPWPFRTGYSPS